MPFFGEFAICHVDHDLIEKYKQERSHDTRRLNGEDVPITRRTVNKQLSYFNSFLRYCEEENIQQFDFKIKRYSHPKENKPKPFTLDEINLFLEHVKPEYRLAFLLMADMGLRRDEALLLKAESIQGDMIYIRGKGSNERVIPITTTRLRDEIKKAMGERPAEFLTINSRTGKPYTTMRKELNRIYKIANKERKQKKKTAINKPMFHHALRHSFGTNAIKSGAFGAVELKEFMGHADIQTTMIYVTLAGADLSEAAARFGAKAVT